MLTPVIFLAPSNLTAVLTFCIFFKETGSSTLNGRCSSTAQSLNKGLDSAEEAIAARPNIGSLSVRAPHDVHEIGESLGIELPLKTSETWKPI